MPGRAVRIGPAHPARAFAFRFARNVLKTDHYPYAQAVVLTAHRFAASGGY
jgi:hypothetical protein